MTKLPECILVAVCSHSASTKKKDLVNTLQEYFNSIPHIKTYRISKIDIKEPCILIAKNHYTKKLFSKIRRVLRYCQTASCYINCKTDRWNCYFTPYYREPYTITVKKDIINNCLLWD